jgi:hypothetical protein
MTATARTLAALVLASMMMSTTTSAAVDAPHKSADEMAALMAQAQKDGRLQTARKTKLVDARPAKAGEVIVTVIAGEGKETASKPAAEGDRVVRNRCPKTGNEQYLVAAAKFTGKYEATGKAADKDGWQEHRPLGSDMRVLLLDAATPPFTFTAPWGEAMAARGGDAILQDPKDAHDIYRVARASFDCTYEVVKP